MSKNYEVYYMGTSDSPMFLEQWLQSLLDDNRELVCFSDGWWVFRKIYPLTVPEWKAYVPGWGAPAVNKRYLVKLINDWITIATYYLRVGGGYWKDDRGQELADGVVSLWKGLEE